MTPQQVRRLATFRRTVRQNPFIQRAPTPRQTDFLSRDDVPEILYGGAAGGGKSEALLMAALQYAEVPWYSAILFRRTHRDLALPGALMDRAAEVLTGKGPKWNGQEKVWTFPSGATLAFGYLDSENDRFRYQSSEFQYVGFDELTQFKERDYKFLFSRLRRTAGNDNVARVPLRMRAGSNPGGIGHTWVKNRFIKKPALGREFVPAKLEDNPHIDAESYEKLSLSQLDSKTYKQYRHGDWTDFDGNHYYPRLWPRYVDTGDAYRIRLGNRYHHTLKAECTRVVVLDWAMGKPKSAARARAAMVADDDRPELSGDCTAFVAADLDTTGAEGRLFLLGCVAERIPLGQNAPRLAEQCRRWLPLIVCGDNDNLSEAMLLEVRRYPDIPEVKCLALGGRNKLVRSQAAIVRAERGLVYLPEDSAHGRRYDPYSGVSIPQGRGAAANSWVDLLSDQLESFTGADGEPDDVADCVSLLGRLADEFRPNTADEEVEPDAVGGYDGGGGAGYDGGGMYGFGAEEGGRGYSGGY